jgi:chromosomal replication initiator protein
VSHRESTPPTEPRQAWDDILGLLSQRVEPHAVVTFLRPLQPVALTATEFRLRAPDRLSLTCVTDNYVDAIRQALGELIGPRQVVIDLRPEEQGELFPSARRRRRPRGALVTPPLNPRYTFDRFVVGASNQFAHAACAAVASQPAKQYNPLFLYGGVGLGKTHLATAIGHRVLERDPDATVAYLSSERFMNELISALRRDRMDAFQRWFRGVDVLIVDDVQFLAGRDRTQEEFFHTFNTLHGDGRQIVLTSDKIPQEIAGLEERLRNRFEWGLIADIQPPDLETRVAIVQRKAELESIPIGHEVALLLAERIPSNVRELEGALTRLGAQASLEHRVISLEYARHVLRNHRRPSDAPSFEQIRGVVCERFSLPESDLCSRRRSRHVVLPRQVAMYLCRRLLAASYPRIGELFGRDHSTVMHGVATIERLLKGDEGLRATVETLERTLVDGMLLK